MTKLSAWKKWSAVLVLCAATAVVVNAQVFTTLVDFNEANGSFPYLMSLIQGTDGNLYGTTASGGAYGSGTVFKITPQGTLTTLYSFCPQANNCTDGANPSAGLVLASDGNFYGTTQQGGDVECNASYGCGTVFKINAEGSLKTVHRFVGAADGEWPFSPLLQAFDGNLYGTTLRGGTGDSGTVFKIGPRGALTTLFNFCDLGNCADGFGPYDGLIQATDGRLYGTTYGGGTDNGGTIFRVTTGGNLTTLLSFSGADGEFPYGALVQASDGDLYGTTQSGGKGTYCGGDCFGTILKLGAHGLTTLYTFCDQPNCADGALPYGSLTQATDANFYGTTFEGGEFCSGGLPCGTVFQINGQGVLTTVHSFENTDGASPYGGLVQATSGTLYGTTALGGILRASPAKTAVAQSSACRWDLARLLPLCRVLVGLVKPPVFSGKDSVEQRTFPSTALLLPIQLSPTLS